MLLVNRTGPMVQLSPRSTVMVLEAILYNMFVGFM